MANLNKIMLMGRLTRSPERFKGADGIGFGFVVNRKYNDRDGKRQEEATFLDCEAWGKTAETLFKFCEKGTPLYIEGRLRLNQWTDKDGARRSKILVVVERFQFLGAETTKRAVVF